jgi:hypothetical protein
MIPEALSEVEGPKGIVGILTYEAHTPQHHPY